MEITYVLPHVFKGRGNAVENAKAVKILLDCLINLNLAFLDSKEGKGTVPLYRKGIRYRRGKKWLTIPALYSQGWGDCKSLTAALVAEYRRLGIKAAPVFRFAERPDGSMLYHILVMTPDKNGYEKTLYEDPSRRLGMGSNAYEVMDI